MSSNRYYHTSPKNFTSSRKSNYGVVSGNVQQNSEHQITGRSGDHLQFSVQVDPSDSSQVYQVDVNSKSYTGTNVQVYTAVEQSSPAVSPSFGFNADAQLSYSGIGLTDASFNTNNSENWLISALETALNAADFVEIYGTTFQNPPGIHLIHYNPQNGEDGNRDGAVAAYSTDDSGNQQITWFFFKFREDSISS